MTILDQYQVFTKKYPKKAFHYRGDVMNYRLFGTGEKTIVLWVGSSMFTTEAYFKLQEALAERFQVLTVEDLAMKISVERIIDCLSYLIKFIGLKKVSLLGMSHGGGLAQAFARDHASQTENLILYNAPTRPKKGDEYAEDVIKGILHTIEELKNLRKIMPLSTIKQALLDQIKQALSREEDVEFFEFLISKYTETDERQQMEIIRDLLSNYAFERMDFKYLNYRTLLFYSHDEDPLGGSALIEALVDMMTNPKLQYIETDRFQLILDPKPMVQAVKEFLIPKEQKSAL